jgi:hypothetical protein
MNAAITATLIANKIPMILIATVARILIEAL